MATRPFDRDRRLCGRLLDRQLHGVDVGEDLGHVGPDVLADVGLRLGSGEAPSVGLEALDLRGRDRFGSQQQPHQRPQGRTGSIVERADRGLGVGDDASQLGGDGGVEVVEPIGEEGVVLAGLAVLRGRVEGGIVRPGVADVPTSHLGPLLSLSPT